MTKLTPEQKQSRAPRTATQAQAGDQNFYLGSLMRTRGALIELQKRDLSKSSVLGDRRLRDAIHHINVAVDAFRVQFECDRAALKVDSLWQKMLDIENGLLLQQEKEKKLNKAWDEFYKAARAYDSKYHAPGRINGLSQQSMKDKYGLNSLY